MPEIQARSGWCEILEFGRASKARDSLFDYRRRQACVRRNP